MLLQVSQQIKIFMLDDYKKLLTFYIGWVSSRWERWERTLQKSFNKQSLNIFFILIFSYFNKYLWMCHEVGINIEIWRCDRERWVTSLTVRYHLHTRGGIHPVICWIIYCQIYSRHDLNIGRWSSTLQIRINSSSEQSEYSLKPC